MIDVLFAAMFVALAVALVAIGTAALCLRQSCRWHHAFWESSEELLRVRKQLAAAAQAMEAGDWVETRAVLKGKEPVVLLSDGSGGNNC